MVHSRMLRHAIKEIAAGLSVISLLAATACVPAMAAENSPEQPQTASSGPVSGNSAAATDSGQSESQDTQSTNTQPQGAGTDSSSTSGSAVGNTPATGETGKSDANSGSSNQSQQSQSQKGSSADTPSAKTDATESDTPSADASSATTDATRQPETQQQDEPQAQSADTDASALDALAAANQNLVPSGEYTISSALNSELVLDVAGGSKANGANVQIYEDNATAAQRWKVTNTNGYLTIVNAQSGKSLDVTGGSNQPGANVQQYASNHTQAQRWVAVPNGGYVTLRSAVDPSKQLVLDVAGGSARSAANVQTFSGNGTKAQQWKFETPRKSMAARLDALAAANKDVVAAGTYTVASGLGSNLVLDVAGASKANGANVQNYQDNATAAQRWKVVKDSTGYLTLINEASGKTLDIAGGRADNGANVQQYASNGSRAQKWIAIPVGDHVVLQSAIAVLHPPVLDVAGGSARSGANVQVYARNNSKAQQWKFDAPHPGPATRLDQLASENRNTLTPGEYTIASAVNSKFVLDVAGSSAKNSANVQIYTDNASKAQRWKVTRDSSGYLTITNEGSGKVLDVAGASAKNSANVQQYASNGSRAQKWIAIRSGNNITLRSALVGGSALVLDVAGGNARNSANVQIYSSNGTKAQQWRFVPLAEVKEPVRTYWNKNLWLGRPTAAAVDTAGGYKQTFQNGVVYYRSASRAVFSVRGGILSKYNSLGAEQGTLGFPTGDEKADNAKRGQSQQFEHGQIVWSQNGTFVLQGDIQKFWAAHQSDTSWLGYPKSDATVQQDGSTVQTFEQGTLISDPSHTAAPSIWTRWSNEGSASGRLGKATDNIVIRRADGSYVKQFAKGIIAATSATDANATRVVSGQVYTYWLKHQDAGDPTGELTATVNSGSWQSFTNGTIYVSAKHGVHMVGQALLAAYAVIQAERGVLGFPTSDQRALTGGVSQTFEHGEIHWSQKTGAHATRGSIQDYWSARGWQDGWLGWPTGDQLAVKGGASQAFQGGTVFWSQKAGAHAVKGSILGKYAKLKWEQGKLGFPTSEQRSLKGGSSQTFQNGEIHSSALGAYATVGAIQQYWSSNGWETGWLGWPTGDELDGLRDGGASQTFQGGTVFWSPKSATHGVSGSILGDYASRGYENSSLGYPTSEEYDYGKGRAQNFQHGRLTWNGCGKRGWQNPAGYFQVSSCDVSVPQQDPKFAYASPSRIGMSATRDQAVEAMIGRAYDYMGTQYVWDYALRPGEGVDCAGLVMQALYAAGMNLNDYNPYAHWYDPYHSHDANNMAGDSRFMSVSLNNRKRGDLLFWPGHVAIYLGNDQIIEAWPGQVRVASMWVHGTPTGVKRPFI